MAYPLYFDRVKETSTTTGTGTLTLLGAVAGFRSFSVVGDGKKCYYCISAGADWEVGLGTYVATGTELQRNTVLASSNSNAAVSFAAGTKDVFLTLPAAAIPNKSTPGLILTADHTFSDDDIGKRFIHPASDTTKRTLSIPSNATLPIEVGTEIPLVNAPGAGPLDIEVLTDSLRRIGIGDTGKLRLDDDGLAWLIKSAATQWMIHGYGLSTAPSGGNVDLQFDASGPFDANLHPIASSTGVSSTTDVGATTGYSGYFSGATPSQVVMTSDSMFAAGSGQFALQMVLKPSALGGDVSLFDNSTNLGRDYGMCVILSPSGAIKVYAGATYVIASSSGTIPTGSFSEIVLQRRSTATNGFELWINGSLDTSATMAGAYTTNFSSSLMVFSGLHPTIYTGAYYTGEIRRAQWIINDIIY